ncbi:MAG: hypothetical protein BSOLF_0824 [Candidatus Carbobacillus altaicus]|uniref:Swt1-like HEPN domain-containing protein n=1 Tax=Candidatus Carbonibacillus altaicus TaxID=2163959 RepID=A0A2R6Y099_9BACL|nr:MAG: hypothetical protein BSOLF_0824 [Candidatus Carbobacillus altaicus]
MAITNHERVGRAMDLLRSGLAPFVGREVRLALKQGVIQQDTIRRLTEDPLLAGKDIEDWDVAALLKLMWEIWNDVFRKTLGYTERSLVSELREWRNRWAHQESFSGNDAYRVLDSASRLLSAISASQAGELERMKMELLRIQYDEQVRNEKRKAGGSLIDTEASRTLKPWREVISPHPDVASGRYQQAEFAADLWQVYQGEGSDEYRDPVEFFRRTYLTESLKWLIVNAVRRLSGLGGDPVVQLQTNFGGGKTHSMLALYHLFSGFQPTALPGVEEVLKEAALPTVPKARRVVLVGNRISPGSPSVKDDGTVVRTLWGELAWQLGGREAYERVRADDERATNPGDVLRQLFIDHGPCLVLIDEWVAYARQLHDDPTLPGGSFDTQFTFAQALTEAIKATPHCLLVVSLPASEGVSPGHAGAEDAEVGGIRGREALLRLRNVIGRVEVPWRPATAEESFEIVRRRLFQPMTDPEQFKARDVVARAFADLYRTHSGDFPAECREANYERRIKAAYPIHPEVFDRLYGDWATLVNFQRTRGVLRLMASVIHSLWQGGDRNPLILPSSIPMDDPRVKFELTRYLPDNWQPVIEKDIDGPDALPTRIDGEVPNLGRYSACRRVARTIYLGSAPTFTAANRGLEDRRIKLGCVMPGESPETFGDALRRLSGQATYLYSDGVRYWYAPQPNVTSLAEDRAEQLRQHPEFALEEIERRVREAVRRETGEFSRVHPFPRSSHEVPDDPDARLVILRPDAPHTRNAESRALAAAREMLEWRGNQPRLYRNALVFLAADETRLQDLYDAVFRFLAWKSILEERDTLNLPPHQVRTAEKQKESADVAVTARIPETFQWLLVPDQRNPNEPIEWDAIRLQGNESLAVRASKKLIKEALLHKELGGTFLRMKMDEIPLWRGDHVEIRQIMEDFARYVYLPRLKHPSVLVRAIRDGLSLLSWERDSFAYAESYDESNKRYRGLRFAQEIDLPDSAPIGLLVKPDAALRQFEAEALTRQEKSSEIPNASGTRADEPLSPQPESAKKKVVPPPSPIYKRFYAVKDLEPTRAGLEASQIAKEIIAHLAGLSGAKVRVTLEIQAEFSQSVPDHLIRTLTENSRTLRFDDFNFEPE